MPPRNLAALLNIQEKHKYLNSQEDAKPHIPDGQEGCAEVRKATIEVLADALRSVSPIGQALRVLVRRVQHPQEPYSDQDLHQLMLLTLAQLHNEEKS